MKIGSVFKTNKTQAVRLPMESRFPEEVKNVTVRVLGNERILTPVENSWDSFFQGGMEVSKDFMEERSSQAKSERESF